MCAVNFLQAWHLLQLDHPDVKPLPSHWHQRALQVQGLAHDYLLLTDTQPC